MAYILLLQQVTRGKTFGSTNEFPEDPDGKKTGKVFAVLFSVLVFIFIVAVFI